MAKQKKDALIFFRTAKRNKKRVERAAKRGGFKNSSEWLRSIIEKALDKALEEQYAA